MKADFDEAAITYDKDFTNSAIGMAQRDMVWKYVNNYLQDRQNLRVLELNCGTGEDACRFAKKGYEVMATDISEGMLTVARKKCFEGKISFRQLDLNQIDEFSHADQFDLIFSNFGGLNCVDSKILQRIHQKVSSMLMADGSFIAIIMPRFCLWESAYFCLKRKWKDAFRRQKPYAIANVADEKVKTFYYSPSKFEKLGQGFLKRELLKPIGLFIPPSYLENFFRKRPVILSWLFKLDKLLARFSWQAYISDHYYIQFGIK